MLIIQIYEVELEMCNYNKSTVEMYNFRTILIFEESHFLMSHIDAGYRFEKMGPIICFTECFYCEAKYFRNIQQDSRNVYFCCSTCYLIQHCISRYFLSPTIARQHNTMNTNRNTDIHIHTQTQTH